ncbi:MAG: hypothetical protein ACK5V1_15880 [Planctomycetaceae bacterium]|jgi:hypothetical protein
MADRVFRSVVCVWLTWASVGCSRPAETTATPPAGAKQGIFGKTTQDIGVFDPQAAQRVSDQKVVVSDPITAPLTAYGPMVERVSIIAVDQAIALFMATEGRYPKDHDEFMEKVIRANNMKLPVLPNGGQYKYDEQAHTLMVVYPNAQGGNAPANGAANAPGNPAGNGNILPGTTPPASPNP